MALGEESLLLLLLLLLAASLGGAFARLLRLPAAPVQLLFGALLAHGPSAVFDPPAVASLQPVVAVALGIVALGVGARLRPLERAGPGAAPRTLRHVLAEVALVPLLVWLAITTLGGVPAQVALVVGLLALASAADVLESLARRAGADGLARRIGAVARADAAVSLLLALAATWLLRLRFDPPSLVHGPELPLILLALLLGASLTFSTPTLLARAQPLLVRASNLALGLLGVLAGASVLPDALPRGLFIATLVCAARLLGKALAASWVARSAAGTAAQAVPAPLRAWAPGLLLAPGTLLGVGVILGVRDEPALSGFRELFLAVGVWVAGINSTLGPFAVRWVLLRTGAAGRAASLTPQRNGAGADGS